MEVTKRKNGCIFVVSDTGGTPLISVPELSSSELNLLTTMTSVIDSIASVVYQGEISVGALDTSERKLLYIKHKNLVFMLLLPRDVDVSVASSTLKELAKRFMDLFGDDPDDVRGVLLFNAETVEEFQKDVINMLMDIIREMAPEHLDAFLEELFALLKSRGIDVSRVSARFIPISVPYLVDSRKLEKIRDEEAKKIAELCDGRRTVKEIAKQAGISECEAYQLLAKLEKKGVINWKVVYRLKG